jgi:hypothetical protein
MFKTFLSSPKNVADDINSQFWVELRRPALLFQTSSHTNLVLLISYLIYIIFIYYPTLKFNLVLNYCVDGQIASMLHIIIVIIIIIIIIFILKKRGT